MGILIKNGTIVTAVDEYTADILVEGEKITAVGNNVDGRAEEVMDATGLYVLPGGVDQHTHFALSLGETTARGFETTNAAIVGGTTTIVDFAPTLAGMTIKDSVVQHGEEHAAGKAMVDYAFHAVIMDATDALFEEIPTLPEVGVSTIKLLMAYKGTPYYSDDSIVFRALQAAKKSGVTTMVHAENADVIDVLQKQCVANGLFEPQYHAVSRPPLAEAECTARAISLAAIAEAPLFVVHCSCIGAMTAIRDAYMRGIPVYGETCPHYLTLSVDCLSKLNFEGAKYVCSPPLRSPEHHEALWEALQKGWLQVVGSDHCGLDWKQQKHRGRDDFTKIPNGVPGVENRLAVLWTYGVEKGRITRQRLVDVFATAPAKVNGLFPKKGQISIGSDADLVLFDPTWNGVMSVKNSLQGSDYCAYEGMEQKGRVEKVFLRGELVVTGGASVGKKGQGQFIKSAPFGLCYTGM